MQFIRLPKAINSAKRVLPELVLDWIDTRIVQIIGIRFTQKLRVNIQISWGIKGSKSGMPNWHPFSNFTHWAWAIRDLGNHDLFRIIPDPGSQKRITLFLESISTIPFQARTSYVQIPEWGQHSSNGRTQCLVSIFGTFRGTWDQPNEILAARFRCLLDIFSNITNCEIKRPGMLIAWKIVPLSLIGSTNDSHNCCPSRKLILHIPQPIARVHRAVYSATFGLCKAHRFKIEVRLKWEMCQRNCIHLNISL